MVKHLACIMDGNRRWAKQHGYLPWDGHREGVKSVERVIDVCLARDIPYLSLYTFSLENFNRPKEEQHFLFSTLLTQLKKRVITDMVAKGVQVVFVGDRSLFPNVSLSIIEDIEHATKDGKQLYLQLLFCYGGRQDIVHGIRTAIEKVQSGTITLDEIDADRFEQMLWSGTVPAPDIIIRTGGAQRLSNFLLYQAAYSELFFLDCYWPELSTQQFHEVINSYMNRQRNFGA